MKHTKKRNSTITNMTAGSPMRLLFFFALPLMAGNIFQQLYTVTDTAIVGRVLGVEALAALGTVEWFSWMSVGLVQGITQGFSIQIAQDYGAEDYVNLRRTVGSAYVLGGLSAMFLFLIMQLSVIPLFWMMHVPAEVASIAGLYLRIMFCGIPIVMAYNLAASILRALGDGNSSLYAMILASLINVGLDLIFVMVLRWGVAGAAIATLAAQLFSALFCFVKIGKISFLHLERSDLQLQRVRIKKLTGLSIPLAFQNMIIAIGGMIVQSVVNRYGVVFIAGYTATNKLYGLLEMAAISYGFAMTTYTGQNIGAGNQERVSKGVRAGLIIGTATSLVICLLMIVFGRQIIGCFVSGSTTDGLRATQIAYDYLKIMSVFLPVLYVLYIVRSCIQGLGNTVIPMISGISEFVMRTGASLLMPVLMGERGILFAEIIAWSGADLILIPGYFVMRKKEKS